MSKAKISVMEAVRAAGDFARANVRHVAGVLVAVLVLNIASGAAVRTPLGFFIGLAGFVIGVMANAALLRLALAGDHPGDPEFRIGPQGFQWGKPELRLLGAMALLVLFMLLAALFLFLIALVVAVATYSLGDPHAAMPSDYTQLPPNLQLAFSVLLLIFLLACVWVGVRLCLYPAATITEKKVQLFSTWHLTRGQFWPIFAALLTLFVPVLLLAMAVQAASAYPVVQGALAVVLNVGVTFGVAPMVIGLYAHLYRTLHPMAAPVAGAPSTSTLAGPWGSV
jgi:hypothetical protein